MMMGDCPLCVFGNLHSCMVMWSSIKPAGNELRERGASIGKLCKTMVLAAAVALSLDCGKAATLEDCCRLFRVCIG